MNSSLEALEKRSKELDLSASQRKHLLDRVAEYTEEYLDKQADLPAYQNKEARAAGITNEPLSEEGDDIQHLLHQLKTYVDEDGLNATSGKHLAYIPAGGLYSGAIGDFLAAVTNRYAGVFFANPGAVRIENMLIRWMRDMVDFPRSTAGNLASGGSIASLTALVTARDAHKLKGRDFDRTVVYLTAQTHHAIHKALRIAGLGEIIHRVIPMDKYFQMQTQELEKQIAHDKGNGLYPWLVVASAGTTDVGAIDPLATIGDLAKANGLWFHVDAAYGGFFLLSQTGKGRIQGVDKADSVVMDPHKGLFLPYGIGAVLVKDGDQLYRSHYYTADYMQDSLNANEEVSPSEVSPELTKHFRGLRMWLSLKLFGVKPFRAALEEKIQLANYFYDALKHKGGYELGPTPALSVVLFRYLPENGQDPDNFNKTLIQRIQEGGQVFMSSTRVDGSFFLRVAILSFRTHKKEIDLALDTLDSEVNSLLKHEKPTAN